MAGGRSRSPVVTRSGTRLRAQRPELGNTRAASGCRTPRGAWVDLATRPVAVARRRGRRRVADRPRRPPRMIDPRPCLDRLPGDRASPSRPDSSTIPLPSATSNVLAGADQVAGLAAPTSRNASVGSPSARHRPAGGSADLEHGGVGASQALVVRDHRSSPAATTVAARCGRASRDWPPRRCRLTGVMPRRAWSPVDEPVVTPRQPHPPPPRRRSVRRRGRPVRGHGCPGQRPSSVS